MQKLLVAKNHFYLLQKLLVATNHSLLVAKFARYSLQKLLVAKITCYSLQNLLVTRCKKLFVTHYEKYAGTNVYLKPIMIGEFYLFILYFQLTKNRKRFPINQN